MEAKMVVKKILIFVLMVFLVSSFVCAATKPIRLFINDKTFSFGDKIEIYATVYNMHGNPSNFRIQSLMTNKGDTYPKGILLENIELMPGDVKNVSLYSIFVDESFDSDEYSVFTELYYGDTKVDNSEVRFSVDSLKELDIGLVVCGDSDCSDDKKIFVKGDRVYIRVYSKDEVDVFTILQYPSGKTEKIELPTSIKASQIGTYEIEVTASKEGYKTITKKEQFGVIEEEVEIEVVSVCTVDGTCGGEENSQNCPQDCPKPVEVIEETISPEEIIAEEEITSVKDYTMIILIALVIIILIAVLIIYLRKKT